MGNITEKHIGVWLDYKTTGLKNWKRGLKIEEDLDKAREKIQRKIRVNNKKEEQSNRVIKEKGNFYDIETKRLGVNQSGLDRIMSAAGYSLNNQGNVIDRAGRKVKNYSKGLDDNRRAAGKFQMEHLGLMFAGMAVQRAFAGLTQTAKEWMGVGEIMSVTMGTLMLPAMSAFTEGAVLPLSEALMELPEAAQFFIGGVALVGEGVGGLTMQFGQLMLGISSFKQTFPDFNKNFLKLAGSIFTVTNAVIALEVALAAYVMYNYINALAEQSKAWNELGESIESTTDSLDQYGQMTRTIDHSLKGEDAVAAAAITPESVGITPTGMDTSNFRNVTDFGPELPSIESVTTSKKGWLGRTMDWLTGTDSSSGITGYAIGTQNVPSDGVYRLHQGEAVLRKDQAGQEQSVNISYTVNATSMKEVESMLRESERRITSDIRRSTR